MLETLCWCCSKGEFGLTTCFLTIFSNDAVYAFHYFSGCVMHSMAHHSARESRSKWPRVLFCGEWIQDSRAIVSAVYGRDGDILAYPIRQFFLEDVRKSFLWAWIAQRLVRGRTIVNSHVL